MIYTSFFVPNYHEAQEKRDSDCKTQATSYFSFFWLKHEQVSVQRTAFTKGGSRFLGLSNNRCKV